MEEFNIQAAKKRVFHRFTRWYYQGIESTMECLDVPELVALLQAAGFSLKTIGFSSDTKQKQSGDAGGCRVVVECAASGVRAELTASAACRCTRFSAQPQDVQEQASFWHVTTSQESLNSAGGKTADVGSSLLPNLDPARLAVIREVLHLLQDEMTARPTGGTRSDQHKRRLSATSMSSVNHSMESLHVQPGQYNQLENASFERRASISCCEELQRRDQSPLHDDVFISPRPSSSLVITSSSLAVSSDTINTTYSCNNGSSAADLVMSLKTIIQAATNALAVVPGATAVKVTSKTPLIRKDTFNVGDEKMVETASVKKKFRTAAQTPGPSSSRVDSMRRRAPKPPIPTPVMCKPPVPPPTPLTDPVRRRTIHTSVIRETPHSLTRPTTRPPPTNVLEDRAKPSKPLSVLKRLSNVGSGKKKQQPPSDN